MKAGPIIVGQLLQNRNRYCVPIYQRHYVWDVEKQWEPFWNDVRTKAIERLSGRERRFSHFMGAVVLEARGGYSAKTVPSFQVVDGQQRLTTFQIFLAAAREYARVIEHKSAEDSITSYLLNGDAHLMEEPEVEVFKVWPTQYDRALFTDILTLGSRADLKKKYRRFFYKSDLRVYPYRSTPRLLAGFAYFYERIKHAVETEELEDEYFDVPNGEGNSPSSGAGDIPRELRLDAIWRALIEEFKVVEIILDEGDDAQVIFETLNERGEPLLAADLVRNNIFQRADALGENAEILFSKYWGLFEDSSWEVMEKQGRYKKPRIEFFLSNYIACNIAGEVSITKLYTEYKAFIKQHSFENVTAELKDLNRYGGIYNELVTRQGDSELVQFSRRLQPWEVTTAYPLVLRIWNSGELSSSEKKRCLNLLISYIVRRAVCGHTTKNYNKFFLSVIAHLEKNGWNWKQFVEFFLAQKSETSRFPLNEEFIQRWVASPVYRNLQPGRVRSLLEELEIAKRSKLHETQELAKNLTVEHVLPTGWQKHWPLPDGSSPTDEQVLQSLFASEDEGDGIGIIVQRNRLKDTIGNLTLLTQPLNSTVSNGPYDKKREALQDHSLLVMNKEIVASQVWGEKQITARSESLFKLAQSIWAVPSAE